MFVSGVDCRRAAGQPHSEREARHACRSRELDIDRQYRHHSLSFFQAAASLGDRKPWNNVRPSASWRCSRLSAVLLTKGPRNNVPSDIARTSRATHCPLGPRCSTVLGCDQANTAHTYMYACDTGLTKVFRRRKTNTAPHPSGQASPWTFSCPEGEHGATFWDNPVSFSTPSYSERVAGLYNPRLIFVLASGSERGLFYLPECYEYSTKLETRFVTATNRRAAVVR